MYLIITSFSLVSAAYCINAQSIDWLNHSELKWRVNNTAMTDIHNGRQYALFSWLLSCSSASSIPDPTAKLLSYATIYSLCSPAWKLASLRFTAQCCSPSPSLWSNSPKQLFWDPPGPHKWLFCVATEKSHAVGTALHIRLAFCRVLSQWSSTGRHAPCCNLMVSCFVT